MKKFMTLAIIFLCFSSGVFAQSRDTRTDQSVLKNTIVDKKEDKRESSPKERRMMDRSKKSERREIKSHRRSIHEQGNDLQSQGVKHPIRKAKRQARREKGMNHDRD